MLVEFKYQGHRSNVKVIFQGQSQKYLKNLHYWHYLGPNSYVSQYNIKGLRSRSHAKVKVHAQGQGYRGLVYYYPSWSYSAITLEPQLRFQRNLDSSSGINISWVTVNMEVVGQISRSKSKIPEQPTWN